MKWENKAIISETLIDRLPAKDYLSEYKFDFDRKSIGPEMVQGLEAFIQKFKRVLLTPKTPKTYYGLADSLPTSLNQEEFNEQSEKLAYEIANHQYSDSTKENPNGLGHTVNKVLFIEFDENEKTYTFELSVEGELVRPIITLQAPSVVST